MPSAILHLVDVKMDAAMPPNSLFPRADALATTGRLAPAAPPPPAPASACRPSSRSATALFLAFRSGATGGFDSLAGGIRLFESPGVALAGRVRDLAFDLVVGASITRTARAEGIPHLPRLPGLGLAFLSGPVGFLLFLALRAGLPLRAQAPSET
ncbi:MAG: ABA4-like family protein [Rhodobacteraceae bacterium]|nr:ABA4-like family protein [Paracoccaceae bacterium]